MQKITLIREDHISDKYDFYALPDVCPYCGMGIVPIPIQGYFQNITDVAHNRYPVQVIFQCPISSCRALFITQYHYISFNGSFVIASDLYKSLKSQDFENEIKEISPDFIEIYNQAFRAEQIGLSQIIGPGYRKALEFLIKDYAIRIITPQNEKERVLDSLLGEVIDKYIDDARIKSTAKRAVWLGNDETHYVRKWEDKDIVDLKRLIDMTTKWITLAELSRKFETEMPERKPKK